MLRRLHSLVGLALALPLLIVAMTGLVLSVVPTVDRIQYPVVERGVSVATLAEAVARRHTALDSLKLHDDGAVTATFDDGDGRAIEVVDPATGAGLGPYQTSAFVRVVTDLHRAFMSGDAGRVAACCAAVMLLLLSLTGTALLAHRLGGIGALLRPIRGTTVARWHGELGRLALVGLLLSSLTGVAMSAATFGLLPVATAELPLVQVSTAPAPPLGTLAALRAVDVADLKTLTLPTDAGDPVDLVTTAGEALIDPVSGAQLAFQPVTLIDRVVEVVRMLHTGRGIWALGLLLGLAAAAVPVLSATGIAIWWRRRLRPSDALENTPAEVADTVILVGSEGNTTWGFAHTLQRTLAARGHAVHLAAMNDISAAHLGAARLLILTATYGDGDAPASASGFLAQLDTLAGTVPVAVLGFGDRTYPRFCRYAHDVTAALSARGWPRLLPLKRIDRQSAQEFAAWGRDLGAALGHDLALDHAGVRPNTMTLRLVERDDYGAAVDAPVAILRFTAPAPTGKRAGRLPDFAAGDLVGILPPGSAMPRFYSLASSTRDGVLEICVRLRPDGVCSSFLHGLRPGDSIDAFIRANPSFRPADGATPLILIGAGAGIGPLAGFVRANDCGRPVHLYWGGRSAASDFLYEHELAQYLAEKRLTTLTTAFSRPPRDGAPGAYVQDRIAADAPYLRDLISHGAQILVCGGRDMATAVTHALDAVVRPLGTDLATLKSHGRYVEDVY